MTSRENLLKIFFILIGGSIVAPLDASHLKVEKNFAYGRRPNFQVVWNVYTELCERFGVSFLDAFKKYGITANANDQFRGNEIALLYSIGNFPLVKKDDSENGGIPQRGNLSKHLLKLKEDVEKTLPKDFKGLGVIDFEDWRPVFRQNWNAQAIYRTLSLTEAKNHHPEMTETEINHLSKTEFEASAKLFMLSTLEEVKKLRPEAKWGYYGFPYCLNFRDSQLTPTCPDMVVKENDGINWLFDESDVFYPSLYLSKKYTLNQHVDYMIGKLNEASRVSSMVGFRPVFPYISFTYKEGTYLSMEDMFFAFQVPKYYKMGGVIIWARSVEVNSREKCERLLNYVNAILGPILLRLREDDYIIDKCFEDGFLRTKGISKDHWAELAKAFSR